MSYLLADIVGPDVLIVLGVLILLFGGSQLPKLARSLGSASHEFKKGIEEGSNQKPASDAEASANGDQSKDGSSKAEA